MKNPITVTTSNISQEIPSEEASLCLPELFSDIFISLRTILQQRSNLKMSQVQFPMNKNFNPPVSWYMMIDDWFFFETLLVILSTHVVVVQSFLSPLKACIKTSISNAAFGGMLTNVKN